jgi:hypothetical protein
MKSDATYTVGRVATARVLAHAGRWDDALDLLPADQTAERARIAVDRFWWRLDTPAEAEAQVAALTGYDPVLAGFLDAQLAYTRLLFGATARPGDADLARRGFAAAAGDPRLRGWPSFWLGVLAEHLDQAPETADARYRDALAGAAGEPLLESYAIRHLGARALDRGDASGLDLLRRSYHLRAALGARPHTAAAALALADALPTAAGEADDLRRFAAYTARELRLTWLQAAG